MPVADASNWLEADPETGIFKPNDGLIRRFLLFIYEGAEAGKDGFTPGIWDTALKAAQWHLNDQLLLKDLQATPKAYVKRLPGISACDAKMLVKRKDAQNDGDVDIQANLNSMIDSETMLRGLRFLYSWATDDDFSHVGLARLTFKAEFRHSIATCARGEDLRYDMLASMFTVLLPKLGHLGTTALCFITNGGKNNRSGKKTTTGMIPHNNPLLCAVAAIGLLLIFRWQIQREPHPVFIDYTTLFRVYLYKSSITNAVSMSYKVMHAAFTSFFKYLGVVVSSVTHYGRHEAYQDMDLNNVSTAQVDRLANRVHDAKANSYALNLPLQALSERGGGCPDATKDKRGAHVDLLSDEEFCSHVEEFILDDVAPWLRTEKVNLAAAVAEAARTKSKTEMGKRHLFAGQGSLNAVMFAISVAVVAAAARPRDGQGRIIEGEKHMAALFPNNPVYQLPCFLGEPFAKICAAVRAAENREMGRSNARAEVAAASPVLQRVREELAPLRQATDERFSQLEGKVDLMLSLLSQKAAVPEPVPTTTAAVTAQATTAAVTAQATVLFSIPASVSTQSAAKMTSGTRHRRDKAINYALGHFRLKELSTYATAQSLFDDYTIGVNGNKSIKQLESEGKSWRGYDGAKQRWSELSVIFRFLDRYEALPGSSAIAAVQELQRRLDAVGFQGRSIKPNWHGLIKELRTEPDERARKRQRQATSLAASEPPPWATVNEGGVAPEEDPRLHHRVADAMGL